MQYKFKYFWSLTGIPPEKEINEWLSEHPNIEITDMWCKADQVHIFYIERLEYK